MGRNESLWENEISSCLVLFFVSALIPFNVVIISVAKKSERIKHTRHSLCLQQLCWIGATWWLKCVSIFFCTCGLNLLNSLMHRFIKRQSLWLCCSKVSNCFILIYINIKASLRSRVWMMVPRLRLVLCIRRLPSRVGMQTVQSDSWG